MLRDKNKRNRLLYDHTYATSSHRNHDNLAAVTTLLLAQLAQYYYYCEFEMFDWCINPVKWWRLVDVALGW